MTDQSVTKIQLLSGTPRSSAGTRIACLIVLFGLLTACQENATQPERRNSERTVQTTIVGAEAVTTMRSVPGSIRARQRADLAFRAPGRIASISVRVGDRVEAGQVLAELDSRVTVLRLKQTEAALQRARAQVLEQQRRLQVQQTLHGRGNTTLQALRAAELDVATSEASLVEAEAQHAIAERDLSDSAIRAPFAGTVAAREFEPNAEVATGQVVLRLDAAGPLEVVASVPGSIVARLRPGKTVRVLIAGVEQPVPGRIERVGDRGDNALSFPISVELDAQGALMARSGMAAEIRLELDQGDRVTVPLLAIVAGEAANTGHVFVVPTGGTAVERRAITIAEISGSRAVIQSGLARGERIVTTGVAFLHDRQVVAAVADRN